MKPATLSRTNAHFRRATRPATLLAAALALSAAASVQALPGMVAVVRDGVLQDVFG